MLEIRNWFAYDFRVRLHVPEAYVGHVKELIRRAESMKVGRTGELLERSEGLAYSVRVVKHARGYQVLISYELERPVVEWTGRLAGIDINPEGMGCTVVSTDGNLLATRFFKDNRLISASKNKRKWVLDDLVNRMLTWCKDTHGCCAIALERLSFRGAHDYGPSTNMKLSNFMNRKMRHVAKLHALKMGIGTVEVNPAYTSIVAVAKYGEQMGGFNRHQLAAFVIARGALGYGEAPTGPCLPCTKKERRMWNHCVRYYGYSSIIQTLPRHEPLERKSAEDANGRGGVTQLLTAPPAITPAVGLRHGALASAGAVAASQESGRRAGRVHPNGHASRGDGARGYRVGLPHPRFASPLAESSVTVVPTKPLGWNSNAFRSYSHSG